ncbi:MAG: crosslink repair DNA glycosylase YcaQ family protein [Actinomycetota bacterium]
MALELSRTDARRLAVLGQMLSAPQPRTIGEVVTGLGEVQMDPVSAIARTEHLVLWSRLGKRFKVADLERMLWEERSLFEYWAHIVPTADFGVHRDAMKRYLAGDATRHRYTRELLAANAAFRRYVLRELQQRGPLRTRDLEDRTAEGWRTGGWNDDGRFTGMMLEVLWGRGEVMVAGRDGGQRLWDLAERVVPVREPKLRPTEIARRVVERQLHAGGVVQPRRIGLAWHGKLEGWERTLARLEREGLAAPVKVEGLPGAWYTHGDLLARLPRFRPRTVLLSPFDDLISDRSRAERLFDFSYRIEIYVPKAKRQYGYYVLPILHGDRLIGRLDPRFDRATATLHVQGVWAEPDAPADAGTAIAVTIADLATWRGARDIVHEGPVPRPWRRAIRG